METSKEFVARMLDSVDTSLMRADSWAGTTAQVGTAEYSETLQDELESIREGLAKALRQLAEDVLREPSNLTVGNYLQNLDGVWEAAKDAYTWVYDE